MYGGIGSEWNERTNSSMLFWKGKIFRLDRGPTSSEAHPSPPCFLFRKTLWFICVMIFCSGNYRVGSLKGFFIGRDVFPGGCGSTMENLSFTNWRRKEGAKEGGFSRGSSGGWISVLEDFVFAFLVFFICVFVCIGGFGSRISIIRSASAGI